MLMIYQISIIVVHLYTPLFLPAEISSYNNKTETKNTGEMSHALQLICIAFYVEKHKTQNFISLRLILMHRNYFQNDLNIVKQFKLQILGSILKHHLIISILTKCSFGISIYIFCQRLMDLSNYFYSAQWVSNYSFKSPSYE